MPSPSQISVDLPIQTFGGRVSQYDPQGLPVGASPFNQDVVFSGVNPAGSGLVTGVATRPGMRQFYAQPFAGNPTVNYLKTFVDSTDIIHLLSLDGLGNMYNESPCPIPPGVPALIGTVTAGCIAQSDSLVGREWIAYASPVTSFGLDIPRQYDATNFDRVSQVGPGEPPSVEDENVAQNILPSTAGAQNIFGNTLSFVQTGFTVQVGLTAPNVALNCGFVGDAIRIVTSPGALYDGDWVISKIIDLSTFEFIHTSEGLPPESGGTCYFGVSAIIATGLAPLAVGQPLIVSGCTPVTYNDTWIIRLVLLDGGTNTTQFYIYSPLFRELPDGGNGVTTAGGNIPAGLHLVSVSFLTREQYITKPAPFASWVAGGDRRAVVSNIPLPLSVPNVIGRILIFTPIITPPAILGDFFYFDGNVVTTPGNTTPAIPGGTYPVASSLTYPTMVISDVITTTYTVDFSDAVLQLGTQATQLFRLLELGESASVCSYSSRTFWAGERNKLPNLQNLTFDGGFSGNRPLGWTLDAADSPGGLRQFSPIFGGAFAIIGDGVSVDRGLIFQSAFQDFLGTPIIQSDVNYSVRIRVKAYDNTLAQGALVIDLHSLSGVEVPFSILANQVNDTMQEFIGQLGAIHNPPADLVLRIFGTNTITANTGFVIDNVEIFPTKQPYNLTLVRGSYAGDPESFDQTTGYLIVGQDNGQPVRALFTLLDNKLYIVKERSLYVTQDDGKNEPANWPVTTVSGTVGTGSSRGVGIGESWAVIAHHDGLYIFWGGEPVKISQEIQPDWDTINWAADQTIYVVVDTLSKRIHVGVPTGTSTKPNLEFVLDYSQLANAEGQVTAQDIAAHPQAYYSVYNPTHVMAPGKARKWTVWNLSMNCATLAVRSDGTYQLLRGNATGTGKVYSQSAGQLSDDGVAINSQYQTSFFPQGEDEQALQLGAHRKTMIYLTGYANGAGTMTFNLLGSQNQRSVALSNLTLQNPAHWDFEKNVNFESERMSLLVGTNAVGAWFELTKLIPVIQRSITTPVRGVS